MSKASDWAQRMAAYEVELERLQSLVDAEQRAQPAMLRFFVERFNGVKSAPSMVAYVRHDGQLAIAHAAGMGSDARWLTPLEAVDLAQWILDVFSEAAEASEAASR